jgi:hypothetical protein
LTQGTVPSASSPSTTAPVSATVVSNSLTVSGAIDNGGTIFATASDQSYRGSTPSFVALAWRSGAGGPVVSAPLIGGIDAPLAEAAGRLWVGVAGPALSPQPAIVELDPTTLRVRRTVPLAMTVPTALVATSRSVWIGGEVLPQPGGAPTGAVDRLDVESGRLVQFASSDGDVGGLALSPDGATLYEFARPPPNFTPTLLARSTTTGRLRGSRQLPEALAPGTVQAAGGSVWADYPTGMANTVTGYRASDLTELTLTGTILPGESAGRIGMALAGTVLYVSGLQSASCINATTGRVLASFSLPFDRPNTPVAIGLDGFFGVTLSKLVPVTIPTACR